MTQILSSTPAIPASLEGFKVTENKSTKSYTVEDLSKAKVSLEALAGKEAASALTADSTVLVENNQLAVLSKADMVKVTEKKALKDLSMTDLTKEAGNISA